MSQPTSLLFPMSIDASLEVPLLVREGADRFRDAKPSEVLQAALAVLAAKVHGSEVLASPQAVRDYLRIKLGLLEHEVFAVIHLDAQHRVIAYVEMFRGTVTQASVYPREVVKEALAHNAAAVVLVHNHPSGVVQQSRADELLTQTLKSALSLVDVRVLEATAFGTIGVLPEDVCGFGEVNVTTRVTGFKKVRFHTHEA